MDPKSQPQRQAYVSALRAMSSTQRVRIAFDLSNRTKRLLKHALRCAHPDLPEPDLHKLFLQHLERCHNQNY
jgi:hypothetical protein